MNSGMFQVPDSHPTPSAFLLLVLGFFFLVGRSGRVFRLRGGAWLLRFVASVACTYNACITTDGGRWTIHPPPPVV